MFDFRLTASKNWDTTLGHRGDFDCRMAFEIKGFFGLLSPPVGVTSFSRLAEVPDLDIQIVYQGLSPGNLAVLLHGRSAPIVRRSIRILISDAPLEVVLPSI